jgi:hypothetical protein
MTAPQDGQEGSDQEEALRRALSDAVSGVEPSPAALDAIRTRIERRRPRSWLAAVLAAAGERLRYWAWPGHWTWPRPLLGRPRTPPLRRRPRPRHRKDRPDGPPGGRPDVPSARDDTALLAAYV